MITSGLASCPLAGVHFFSVLTQLKRLYWVISPRFIAYSVECQWQATVRFARGYVNVSFSYRQRKTNGTLNKYFYYYKHKGKYLLRRIPHVSDGSKL